MTRTFKNGRLFLAGILFFAVGCNKNSSDDAGTGDEDMRVASDMATAKLPQCNPDPVQKADGGIAPTGQVVNPGDVGTACAMDTDCKQGMKPVCWTKNLFNGPTTLLPTPGGYCSSACTQDSDCGVDKMNMPINPCLDFGPPYGKLCIGGCADAQTCRHGAKPTDRAYVCALLGQTTGCFPDANFDCDPTQDTCTLSDGSAGGCWRQALEAAHGGLCLAGCTVGDVGACAPDQGGTPRQCLYLDFTSRGDGFRGMLCFPSAPTPKAIGATCRFTDDCEDGLQCDNRLTGGDKKCEKLCNLTGKSPKCAAGQTCTKVFGGCEAGLCKDNSM